MRRNGIVILDSVSKRPGSKMAVKPFVQNDTGEHGHDCFEMVYVMDGSAVQVLNGVAGPLNKGDYFIIDYGSIHSYEQCRDLVLINCLFMPEIIDETMSDCRSFEELLRVCLIRYNKQYFETSTVDRIFHDEDGRVLALLQGMLEECDRGEVGYREIFRCRLLEILILTMRKAMQSQDTKGDGRPEQSQMILEAIHYLEAHYREKAVLGQFCREYHYSQQYVSRRFKQETGLTALEYLQKIRVEKCCELLGGSDLRIADIAQKAGYDDIKFFHQVFRRLVHMSPREYRKMVRDVTW